MAIDTFSNLKAEIANWLNRSDLSAFYDTLVELGERRLSRDLRVRAMETDLSVVMSNNVAAIPSDFVELKHARINVDSGQAGLENKEVNWIYERYPDRITPKSRPYYIGIDGSNFVFGPLPDTNYTVKGTYFAKPTLLSDGSPTNLWTTNVPDALLLASLVAAGSFVEEERTPQWEAAYQSIVKDYNRAYKRQSYRHTRASHG